MRDNLVSICLSGDWYYFSGNNMASSIVNDVLIHGEEMEVETQNPAQNIDVVDSPNPNGDELFYEIGASTSNGLTRGSSSTPQSDRMNEEWGGEMDTENQNDLVPNMPEEKLEAEFIPSANLEEKSKCFISMFFVRSTASTI